MISLIIPPKDQIARVSKMLADEFGTASNIKSRVNRLSVLSAITSVQQRLKLYTKGMFDIVIYSTYQFTKWWCNSCYEESFLTYLEQDSFISDTWYKSENFLLSTK